MSVEKVGPRGYEYQYLVSTFIALDFMQKDNVQIFIESENGEDLQIQFDENKKTYIIDIQVKNREKQIDLEEFSEWISHFENRSNEKNLLTKLHSEEDRFVLYVTNARCKDEVSIFSGNNVDINKPLEIGINEEILNKIKTNILKNYSQSSPLGVKRQNFLKDFFLQIKNNELRAILKKNKVWDLQDTNLIEDKISRILNQNFFVPQSKIEVTILELLDIIRLGRDSEYSISSNILDLLKKYKGTRIFNYDNKFVNRIEKEKCLNTLNSKHILLLTGISFCGKTYMAREIAQGYQDNGFTIKITNELHGDNGGLSFLRHNNHEDRLLILEDPFGEISTNEKAIEIVSSVKNMLENCDYHRKLIITTREDILFDAMREKSLDKCEMKTNTWLDLTVRDPKIWREIWNSYFGKTDESMAVFEKINKWLKKNEQTEFLQPGQLVHLYNSQNNISELLSMNESNVLDLARVDSKDLAHKIERRGTYCKYLYIALGLSCNTYKSIHIDDLAFILSDMEDSPSIEYEAKTYFWIEHSNEIDKEQKAHPTYSEKSKIKQEYKTELQYLINHGYIKMNNYMKTVIFTHPIYHFASKILFQSSMENFFESGDVLKIVNRSLSALSKDVNICALMMLESYYLEQDNKDIKNRMLKCLYSIYPSVRDRVIMFFDSRINKLDEEEAQEFVKSIKYVTEVYDGILLWKDGNPYFNSLNKRKFSHRNIRNYEGETISNIQTKLDNKEVLTTHEMWIILNYTLVGNMRKKSVEILVQCLSYDEVFIRENAIFHLFENFAYKFEEIANYLDHEEHPNVIYKLFRGALNSWSKYKPVFQQEILEFYKKSLNIASVSIRSLEFLENFEDEQIIQRSLKEDDIKEIWLVWYDVFVELLNKFPSKYIGMNEPRMVNVANAALKYVTDEVKIINFANAWIEWLDKYSERRLTQESGMSVAEYLIKGTKENFEIREAVFCELLSKSKTSFITMNVKIFIDYWHCLSKGEKQQLLSLLNSQRMDLKWLRAVALNRKIVPEEVQTSIFGGNLFNKSIDLIVDTLIKYDLLEYCINIYCGFPQPLWWYGYHHNNNELWDKIIIRVISGNEYNRAFKIALMEFIDELYNDNINRFVKGYEIFEENLMSDENKRKITFKSLLNETIKQNQANKRLWDLLFENSSINEKKEYFSEITKYIEAVQHHHLIYNDLYCLFDESIILKEIYPRIEEDFNIYKYCELLLQYSGSMETERGQNKDRNQIEINKLKMEIKSAYGDKPPRMSLTNKLVLNVMNELQILDEEIETELEKNRLKILSVGHKMREGFYEEYELENWLD